MLVHHFCASPKPLAVFLDRGMWRPEEKGPPALFMMILQHSPSYITLFTSNVHSICLSLKTLASHNKRGVFQRKYKVRSLHGVCMPDVEEEKLWVVVVRNFEKTTPRTKAFVHFDWSSDSSVLVKGRKPRFH